MSKFKGLRANHFGTEKTALERALGICQVSDADAQKISQQAEVLVSSVRAKRLAEGGIDAFLTQYDLSSEEGIALMCMAEALLRIPDKTTVDALIQDKLSEADWKKHIGASESTFVNAATWGLALTGKILPKRKSEKTNMFQKLLGRTSEPVVRSAIRTAMKILGGQFVMGETIEKALSRAKKYEKQGYLYSYDMLGEAAYTTADAEMYFEAYRKAIMALKDHPNRHVFHGPSISIKLSALYPRYEAKKRTDVFAHMLPKLKVLIEAAMMHDVGLTIDAEESERLEISLEIFEQLFTDELTKDWQGLGLAVQAYQKRALDVLAFLSGLAEKANKRIPVRLVKGAYWDTEIKRAQVMGLPGYPVFTRKVATDVNYLAAAKFMLDSEHFYCQFATHNAHTVASIMTYAHDEQYEFQCLHGMGETLYNDLVANGTKCRIYAPVGSHEHLLAYLVRRLLENGANTSFVNRIADKSVPVSDLVEDPIARIQMVGLTPHPKIPLPKGIYGDRDNSTGIDFMTGEHIESLSDVLKAPWEVVTSEWDEKSTSPIDGRTLGTVAKTEVVDVPGILKAANAAQKTWAREGIAKRARILELAADKLEQETNSFIQLLALEAGKTVDDAIAEIREAVDFCRYYALQARNMAPIELKGPTGERNILCYEPRGTLLCISPWNFPLAIFAGQVVAALVTGNAVIAKAAGQTSLIAAKFIKILHEQGIPQDALVHLVLSGRSTSEHIIADGLIHGVMVTGSTDTAKTINQTLAARKGPILPLIAETGGQNAMIVDSTALPEQVVRDVLMSAFKSAGQRCSALRVLFVQEEVADRILTMLMGAMEKLTVGNPTDITTDIGPVIDEPAAKGLNAHIARMKAEAKYLASIPAPEGPCFVSPHLFEIDNIDVLTEEVFGPILHVCRYKASELDKVIEQINSTGFGLTFGVHSRIGSVTEKLCEQIHAGNIYINRNMIGAVVGVQPFGGMGESGTGPKAGGPNYLKALVHEKTISTDTTAQGGNASLVSLGEG